MYMMMIIIQGENIIVSNTYLPVIVIDSLNFTKNFTTPFHIDQYDGHVYEFIRIFMKSLNNNRNEFDQCMINNVYSCQYQNIILHKCQHNNDNCNVQMDDRTNVYSLINDCMSHILNNEEFNAT